MYIQVVVKLQLSLRSQLGQCRRTQVRSSSKFFWIAQKYCYIYGKGIWGLKFALLKFPYRIRTTNILYFVNWYSLMNLKFAKFELSRAIFTPQLSILVFQNDLSSRVWDYRMHSIIICSWFEATLDYKLRIFDPKINCLLV